MVLDIRAHAWSKRRVNLQRRFSIVSEMARGSMSRVYRAIDNPDRADGLSEGPARRKERGRRRAGLGQGSPPTRGRDGHPSGASPYRAHSRIRRFDPGRALPRHGIHRRREPQYVRESRSARTAQKVELLAQAAEGLAAVHAAGFIHHDINPRNFLVDREQQVKLIDFGLTVPNTPAFCRPGNRTGTMQYMAPELLRREPIDERIDIFAFGVLAFEFLTDRLPYDATNTTTMMLQRINAEPLDPAVVKPKLSDELCESSASSPPAAKNNAGPSMSNSARRAPRSSGQAAVRMIVADGSSDARSSAL